MFSSHSLARSHTRRLRGTSVLFLIGAIINCSSDEPTTPTLSAGTYSATTFRAVPTGQAPIDVLAAGGSLSVTIAADKSTTGTLNLPASVTGGAPFTATMTGTAVQTGSTVQFQQTADTFVRNLTWQLGTNTLTVVDQTAGGASFTITLKRQ